MSSLTKDLFPTITTSGRLPKRLLLKCSASNVGSLESADHSEWRLSALFGLLSPTAFVKHCNRFLLWETSQSLPTRGLLESRIRYEDSEHRHLSQPVATPLRVDSRPRELPVWLIFALSVEASGLFLAKGENHAWGFDRLLWLWKSYAYYWRSKGVNRLCVEVKLEPMVTWPLLTVSRWRFRKFHWKGEIIRA